MELESDEEEKPLDKKQQRYRDLTDKREYVNRRLNEINELWQRANRIDQSMEAELAMLKVQSRDLDRHHSESDDELTEDGVMRTARLSGDRKRKAIRMQQASAKRRKQMEAEADGYPDSLLMETTLNTNDKQKETYRLANYHSIRARNNPQIELRPIAEYPVDQILRGWLVVNHNTQWNETYVRGHASKRYGTRDHKCTIQNQTLAVILEIDETAKAKPYGGTEECGTMRIRTIGEEAPIEGWCSINYFYVLTHRKEPLFAPQTADDDFWRSVVVNLGEHETRIGQYYNEQLKGYVHLPFPRPPPAPAEPATDAPSSHWQSARGWQWTSWQEGRGSSSSSRWQGNDYGQWQDRDWQDHGSYNSDQWQ